MVPLARLELFKFARCYTRFHALPLMRCHLLHVLKSSRKQNFWITKHITMCGAQHIVITIEKEYELIFIVLLGTFFFKKLEIVQFYYWFCFILEILVNLVLHLFLFEQIDTWPEKVTGNLWSIWIVFNYWHSVANYCNFWTQPTQALLVVKNKWCKGNKVYFFFFTLFTFFWQELGLRYLRALGSPPPLGEKGA